MARLEAHMGGPPLKQGSTPEKSSRSAPQPPPPTAPHSSSPLHVVGGQGALVIPRTCRPTGGSQEGARVCVGVRAFGSPCSDFPGRKVPLGQAAGALGLVRAGVRPRELPGVARGLGSWTAPVPGPGGSLSSVSAAALVWGEGQDERGWAWGACCFLGGRAGGALMQPSDRCACKCVPVCALVLGRLRGKARQEGERKGSWGGREELVAPPQGPLGTPRGGLGGGGAALG